MAPFTFGARVVRVIDGDTILVDPDVYPQDTHLRVRFRDVFAPERGEEGYEEANGRARLAFPEGSRISLRNDRSRWTYGRLEARVDPEGETIGEPEA